MLKINSNFDRQFEFNMRIVCLALILLSAACAHSLKILGIAHVASYSHYSLGARLMKELAARGHDVTMVAPYTEKNPVGKYKTIELTGTHEQMEAVRKEINFFSWNNNTFLEFWLSVNNMGYRLTEAMLHNPNFQKLLNSNEKFDLIIMEQFLNDAFQGICHHFKASCIMLSSMGSNSWTNGMVANPTFPSYIPEVFTKITSPMCFWTRVENTIIHIYSKLYTDFYMQPKHESLMKKVFPDAPSLAELKKNVSLVLLNSHVSMSQAVPHVPGMIEIGGYHVYPPKKLPEDIQKYLDSSKNGVIYFSMGSNLRSKDFPLEKRQAILNVFSKLKVDILWKFEEDLPGKTKNIKIEKWLPQQDILAHPNVKAFITHGGLLSTIEAIYSGVPVVGIPIYGDQVANMVHASSEGFAVTLHYGNLTEEGFGWAVNEILNNKKYNEVAKFKARIMHDQPIKPIDSAVFWIEYVGRYGGADHLRTVALDMTWYQIWAFDVIGFLLVILIVAIIAVKNIFKCLFKLCFGGSKPKMSKSKKSKRA